MFRFDRADKTQEGFLQGVVPISRIGVFPYRNQDGSMRYEARLPQHVFSKDSLDSFKGLPVQVEHNAMLDTPEAVGMFKVGQIGDDVHVDGELVKANVRIDHPDGIAAFDAGTRELSCGYSLDLVEVSGEFMGKKYTHMQTNIRGDHLAITRQARLGSELRLDSADAIEQDDSQPLPQERPMKKHNIDGIEYEAAPEVINFLSKETRRADSAEAKAADAATKMTAADAAHAAEKSTLQAKLDVATAEKTKAEDSLKALEKDLPVRLAALAKENADTMIVAQAVLAADELENVASMDSAAIKAACIAAKYPEIKLDGKDASYVTAMFDAVKAGIKETGSNALAEQRKDSAQNPAPSPDKSKHLSANDAREAMVQKNQNAWKTAKAA